MKQFALIGLGTFNQTLLPRLRDYGFELLLIDKDELLIERFKDLADQAVIADAYDEAVLQKLLPENLDAALIDLGAAREVSILVTHYLARRGLKQIIVKAESPQHGEILKVVGATRVLFPEQEAADKLLPQLVSSLVFNYLPISKGLVMAEIGVPPNLAGLSLIEANLRQTYRLNVVAIRASGQEDFEFFEPAYKLKAEDLLLIVGRPEDVEKFAVKSERRKAKGPGFFARLFGPRPN